MAAVNKDGALAGKVAIVTGASRGIGEAIAARFAQEGARVIASARTAEEGESKLSGTLTDTINRITRAGGEARFVKADLAIKEDRERLVETAVATYGPVDILVNNAAITYFIPVADFPEKRFKLMMEVQVYAPFHLSQLVLPSMKERHTGWIVNISSGAGIHPEAALRRREDGTRRHGLRHVQGGARALHHRPRVGGRRRRRQRERGLARPGRNARHPGPQPGHRRDP